MNQSPSVQRLTDRLKRIEAELDAIRRELKAMPRQQDQISVEGTGIDAWVDKEAVKKQMQQLFQALSIQGEPIGAESLQKQMREANLASNELSQAIITAREE